MPLRFWCKTNSIIPRISTNPGQATRTGSRIWTATTGLETRRSTAWRHRQLVNYTSSWHSYQTAPSSVSSTNHSALTRKQWTMLLCPSPSLVETWVQTPWTDELERPSPRSIRTMTPTRPTIVRHCVEAGGGMEVAQISPSTRLSAVTPTSTQPTIYTNGTSTPSSISPNPRCGWLADRWTTSLGMKAWEHLWPQFYAWLHVYYWLNIINYNNSSRLFKMQQVII